MTFEVPYPTTIPETTLISNITMLKGFNGTHDGCLLFGEPVDVSLFKLLHLKFPHFISRQSLLHDFQTTFQDYTKSSVALVSPECTARDGEEPSLTCLLTCATVYRCESILVSKSQINDRVARHAVDVLLLAALYDNDLTSLQESPNSQAEDRDALAVDIMKLLLKALEEKKDIENELMENGIVSKLRAALECLLVLLSERLMKYIINFVRALQNQELVAQGFNELILNPLLIRKMTPQAKYLMQDFISVYFRQLSTLAPFNRYLSKRLFLIEVILILT